MKKEKLYIPTKILDSDDYIAGFGNQELVITGVVSVISILIGLYLYQMQENTFIAVAITLCSITATIFLIRRDICNENVFQKIKILWKNSRMQKRYFYFYKNIYEDIPYEE